MEIISKMQKVLFVNYNDFAAPRSGINLDHETNPSSSVPGLMHTIVH